MNTWFAERDTRHWFLKPALVAVAGMLTVAIAIGINLQHGRDVDRAEGGPNAPAPPPLVSEPVGPAAAPAGPSFDVVRINPGGDTVMAGRATPGATVVIESNQAALGQVTADPRGEWVFLPETPLPPGSHVLQLRVRGQDGNETVSADDVLVVVPAPNQDVAGAAASSEPAQPLALRIPRTGGPATVLQKPVADAAEAGLRVDAIDWEQSRLAVDGHAPPGSRVRLTIDGKAAGEAVADAAGVWRIAPTKGDAGSRRVFAIEQLDASGKPVDRVQVPFGLQETTATPSAREVVVQRGGNLWRIARSNYGRGTAYTIIYDANRKQIGSPDRIYPGQVFRLPESAAAPVHD